MKSLIIGAGIFLTTTLLGAATINIPDNNFDGLTAVVNGPLSGYLSNHIGAWSAEFNVTLGVESIAAGTSSSIGCPSPLSGGYVAALSMPAGLAASERLSQTLTNNFLPNSLYTLTADLSEAAVLDLAKGTTLSIKSGSQPLASLSGLTLAAILNASTNFHTVTVTYKTGNTAPPGTIGIALDSSAVGSLGAIYANNFQLTVQPISVQVTSQMSGTNFTLNGSGGATNATYIIFSSTNLLQPVSGWTPIATNTFDSNGAFQINVAEKSDEPVRYFRIMLP